jgi:Ca2+-binding RTX toxin-like protein
MVTKRGTSRGDLLRGTNSADTLSGLNGNDRLYGLNGNDRLFGGNQSDYLNGGSGADRLYGQNHNDRLYGGNQNDSLYGGSGVDRLYGQNHNDRLYGGNQNDTLYGGSGVDRLYGQNHNDVLRGGSQNDTLYGGNHNDRLFGDAHNDRLFGQNGIDTLRGGSGNDLLDGGPGRDQQYGDDGNDSVVIDGADSTTNGGTGFDILRFAGASSTVDLRGRTNVTNFERVDLDENDSHTLYLDEAAITALFSGSATGRIYGGSGNHVVFSGYGWNGNGTKVWDTDTESYFGTMTNGSVSVELQFGLSFSATPHRNVSDLGAGEQSVVTFADLISNTWSSSSSVITDVIGDINQDGFHDFVLTGKRAHSGADFAAIVFGSASPPESATPYPPLNGSNGFLIESVDDIPVNVIANGDFNGDAIPDLIIQRGELHPNPPTIEVLYGHTGAYAQSIDIADFSVPGGLATSFGTDVGSVGDINGDGIEDLGVWGDGTFVDVIYGVEGGIPDGIHLRDPATFDGFTFLRAGSGASLRAAGIGDINGDGFGDLIVGAWDGSHIAPGGSHPQDIWGGAAFVVFGGADLADTLSSIDLDGANGFWIYSLDPSIEQLGSAVSAAGDFNGDGFNDFIILSGLSLNPQVHVIFGTDQGFPQDMRLDLMTPSDGFSVGGFGDSSGFRTHALGDLNGDGYADIALSLPAGQFSIGTHGTGSGGSSVSEQGLVYVIYGRENMPSAQLDISELDEDLGFVLVGEGFVDRIQPTAGHGDINGDGYDDIVMSTAHGTTDNYIVYGHADGASHITGSALADQLEGNAQDNIIVAGAGNDTIDGGAGRDVIKAGAGDDVVNYDPADFRVEGDGGTDTLLVVGSNVVLDFTLLDDLSFTGFELVDLGGGVNNSAHLELRDVLALSDTRTLRFDGIAGDSVSTTDDWALQTDPVVIDTVSYKVYENSGVNLLVDIDVDQSGIGLI